MPATNVRTSALLRDTDNDETKNPVYSASSSIPNDDEFKSFLPKQQIDDV